MNVLQMTRVGVISLLSVLLVGGVITVTTADDQRNAEAKRRIIVNDDGEVVLPRGGKSWDDYLGARFKDAIGTQVDSYFLNIAATDRGPGIVDSLQSSMAYWAAGKRLPERYVKATRRYIAAARKADIEIFASIRMNDVHDSSQTSVSKLTYPLKVKRPDLLIGEPERLELGRRAYPDDSLMRWFWCGLDWGEPEVRQHFLDFIATYCRQFDFDGLELDYFRHPLFFKLGEEEQYLDNMTDFVRQVREVLNKIGDERKRPYLLAVRVPDTLAFSRRTGLHVERWLKEGYLDLLVVGGGYLPYSGRLKELMDLAHRHNVPAYPCLNHFRGPVQMRTVASNFWALGGDGFYLFNYFGVTGKEVNPGWGASSSESLRQIGSPKTLRGLHKLYQPDPGSATAYIGYNNAPPQLPVRLIDGRAVELVVGGDVGQASRQGRVKELRLQVQVANLTQAEGIAVQVNGHSIRAESVRRVDEKSLTADLTAPPLRRGINWLTFLPGPKSNGALSSQVTGLQLSVRYK
ncbi:MAG: hypothetical protein V3T53_08580 [Phycisphaerales bacterium]